MTVILRKLTKKSTLDFGKYRGLSIQSVLNLGRAQYLKWCYYNLSNISFVDELIDELNITRLIKKPGKDEELWDKHYSIDNMTHKGLHDKIAKASHKKKLRAKIQGKYHRDKIYFSKGSLMSRNHGNK